MEQCVVVIDDDPDVLELLRDLLKMEGFSMVAVDNPSMLQRIESTVRPDVFLIDVMLPGASGIEVAAQLRGRGFAQTPMIALSASRILTELASSSGIFDAVVRKPFEVATLLANIEQLLANGTTNGSR